MDSLFEIEPTKPTKLQAARRALADAEREFEDCANEDAPAFLRAIERCAEIVKQEEAAELNNSKQQP
jgi:hypothetical protein